MDLKFLISRYSELELKKFDAVPYDEAAGAVLHIEGEDLYIHFEPNDAANVCHLFTFLCDLPTKFIVEFYNTLLAGHLFGRFTNDCYFGVDNSSKRVVFFKNIKIDNIEYGAFNAAVNAFIKASLAWREAICPKP